MWHVFRFELYNHYLQGQPCLGPAVGAAPLLTGQMCQTSIAGSHLCTSATPAVQPNKSTNFFYKFLARSIGLTKAASPGENLEMPLRSSFCNRSTGQTTVSHSFLDHPGGQ